VLASHDLERIAPIADRVVEVVGGRLSAGVIAQAEGGFHVA
jgi:energy-coupling factor transporter ATP-binding protein EcfA2